MQYTYIYIYDLILLYIHADLITFTYHILYVRCIHYIYPPWCIAQVLQPLQTLVPPQSPEFPVIGAGIWGDKLHGGIVYIHTLHYITLHYTTIHYITLHTYMYIYIYAYMSQCRCMSAMTDNVFENVVYPLHLVI